MDRRVAIHTEGPRATERAGAALADAVRQGDVLLLSGDLGAGKTTLVKGLARGLGVRETVTSPTFNLLVVHEGARFPLFHFDLYRLEDSRQLVDLDYWGTLEAGGVAAVEWGDRFAEDLPDDYLSIAMHILDDEDRLLDLGWGGPRGRALADEWTESCRSLDGVTITDAASSPSDEAERTRPHGAGGDA